MGKRIYLDHAATTPIDPEVFKEMEPYFTKKFGNPSSIHSFGQEAVAGVDWAREKLAEFLDCTTSEIIFTSGATESNNLAVFGLVRALQNIKKLKKIHIITSSIEHPALLEPYEVLKKEGIEATFLPVNRNGLVEVEEVSKSIKPETVLVSVMYVNNEVGTIQPIKEIGELLEKINKQRTKDHLPQIYFHTDAAQAASYCDCNVKHLKVDLMSLNGHKIYGPKGVGALFIKKGTPLQPVQFGGHQEQGIRSGTINAPLIVGFGRAIELIINQPAEENNKIRRLRDKLKDGILEKIHNVQINGDLEKRTPNNLNISFKKAEGESILLMLDMEGIAVSTGSACSSGSLEPSHVLTAMKIPPEISHGSIRFTLGKNTTENEIAEVLSVLPGIIEKLRKITGSTV